MAGETDTAGTASATAGAAEAATASYPKPRPCWPDDPYYPDGYTEIDLPSSKLLRASFDTRILEPADEPQPNIIDAEEPFKVRFRLVLKGQLWYCMCGDWWFDLGFSPTGEGKGFDLSDLVNRELFYFRNWRGCDTLCIERVIEVPPNTIPTDYCGRVYQCAARVQLFCCGRPAAMVGFDLLGAFQFFKAEIERP